MENNFGTQRNGSNTSGQNFSRFSAVEKRIYFDHIDMSGILEFIFAYRR
jgi:hypothetical protein